MTLNLLEIILFCYFSFLVSFSVFRSVLPSILLGFRCSPSNSHPDPPKFPPPVDQISLDSGRRNLLDSARSLRDVYASEVRFTLHALNEILEHKSMAEYQRRLFEKKLAQINGIMSSIFLFLNFGVLLFGISR
ncbi:unnamed protein product, partial [Mesorhabditis belari]|uniref:Transmembrane protein n=1 Tax=Mesorhabditis belari TaxID=2138241 RepID=A0AAF3J7B5_9BILA